MRTGPGLIVVFGVLLAASACGASGSSGSSPLASPSATGGPASSASPSPADSPPTAPGSSPASPGGAPGGSSALTVVVDDVTGATSTWTLTGDPVVGDHPDPAEACAAIEGHRSALRPVPKDRMCAQVYGGPEKATITGTWRGEQVFAALTRTNACETARWDALVPLVPSGGR